MMAVYDQEYLPTDPDQERLRIVQTEHKLAFNSPIVKKTYVTTYDVHVIKSYLK